MIRDIIFKVDNQKLVGTLYKSKNEKASILIVAGGANIPRNEGVYPSWQEYLAERGITTFNFDFRGVGESEGNLENTNLDTRTADTKEALNVLKKNSDTENVYILGRSMGGPVAIQVADSSIQGLLLMVPAAYSAEARDKNFGSAFSEAIRKPASWEGSLDFKKLSEYTGKLFFLYASDDNVIPGEISAEYEKVVTSRNGTVLVMKDATHTSWATNQANSVLDSVTQFILK